MQRPCGPYLQIHNLLALAGAGDIKSLDNWLQGNSAEVRSKSWAVLRSVGLALRAYVTGAFIQSALIFSEVVPRIAEVGGSSAQNQLFTQFRDVAAAKSHERISHVLSVEVA